MHKVTRPPWRRETKKLWAGCAQRVLCVGGAEVVGSVRVVPQPCLWHGSLDVCLAAGWNPDVCVPNVPACSTSSWAFACALSLTFLVIPSESAAWPSCRTTYQSQPSWPFRGEGGNLAAVGFFCPLVLLCKLLARASQGSAYWLLGCLWGAVGILRVLCLVSLGNFLFRPSSFLLWSFFVFCLIIILLPSCFILFLCIRPFAVLPQRELLVSFCEGVHPLRKKIASNHECASYIT